MKRRGVFLVPILLVGSGPVVVHAQDGVRLQSPGLAVSSMAADGSLREDWGALRVTLTGDGLAAAGACLVEAITLDEIVPAARAAWQQGPVDVTLTAFRAPAWPKGIDVLTVALRETAGEARILRLGIELPAGARMAGRTVALGRRTIVVLPEAARADRPRRDWGHCDDATAMPGWAQPAAACDPAFRSIRAGLDGVPIAYRFRVPVGARLDVALGFCESYWREPGSRFFSAKVEGAPAVETDPLARWGRHQPGVVVLAGEDQDRDGWLEVLVVPSAASPDRNPILNAIWLFPPGHELRETDIVAGRLNALATRRVDVGGEADQALFGEGRVDLAVSLAARGTSELTLLVACPGASLPAPSKMAWTLASLRAAARDVRQGTADR